jgi:hypothetical protein
MKLDDAYVRLERRFTDVHEDPSTAWARRAFGRVIGKPWADVVPQQSPPGVDRSAVVVLAPSGQGKSAELAAHAARLHAAGVAAFVMRAQDLAGHGVAHAVAAPAAFRAWQESARARGDLGESPEPASGSPTEAVFFIDAVDEARLAGHDLERLMLRFAREVDPGTRKIRLVLSSRNDIWAAGEVRHVSKALALETLDVADAASLVRIVRLEPLSPSDVRVLAKANGVRDVDAFMNALAEEEIENLIEFRPPDVRVLAASWKERGAFGTWSEMLEVSIDESVRNENRQYAFHQQFTLDDARRGLARLAAATLLGKKALVSQPGFAAPDEVSAERLFRDMRPAATSQLLAMGFFTQKGPHSVQLTQGPPSHYLAAVWLGERVRSGWDPKALEDILFIPPFEGQVTLAPASRSPVLGWAAGFVPSLRPRLLEELPHVLLFEGDPSRLSRGECIEALRRVLANLRAGLHDVSPTGGTLRQLARHGLASEAVRLLNDFADVPRATRLLLRLVTVGRYDQAALPSLAIALAKETEDDVRPVAIRAAARCGDVAVRRRLLPLAGHPSEWIRLAVVQELAPDLLNGQALVELVLATMDRSAGHLLGHALSDSSSEDIETILEKILPEIAVKIGDRVGERVEPLLEIGSRLTALRLTRSRQVPPWMPRLLLVLESLMSGPFFIDSEVIDEIRAHLAVDADLRRAVWSTRVSAGDAGRLFGPRLGAARPEDLEWFWELREATADTDTKFALEWPLRAALGGLSLEQRAALVADAATDPELRAFAEEDEVRGRREVALEQERKATQQAEQAAHQAENVAVLQPQRTEIEAGRHANGLIWGWQQLTRTDSRRARLGTGRLVELVGADLANAVLVGLQQWWKHHQPGIRAPGENTVLHADLAGLTGLSLAIQNGLELRALGEADAEKAVRYALFELNEFPDWFENLVEVHPTVVSRVLSGVVAAEWAATAEHHGIISWASREPERTSRLIRDLVLHELERAAPGHVRTIHYAIDVLLLPQTGTADLGALLERHALAASSAGIDELSEWVRGWSHFSPERVVKWLEELDSSDRARFLAVVLRVASLLEDDLDERHERVAATAWTPAALETWVRLLHNAVRPEDDIDRFGGGVYSPGDRDRAQSFRNRCLSKLASHPSRAAFTALRGIRAAKEMSPYRPLMDRVIASQLSAAVEDQASPWSERDVLTVERGDERRPATGADLFVLVQRHLARVAALLENDDFSYATLFDDRTSEKEVQRWVASSLMLVGRGLYTVEREPEVQDDKAIDISVAVPGVGRVPIEIKPLYASRYTFEQLCACISGQLLGRYMRPPSIDRGILLLVPLRVRTWKVNGRRLTFTQLRARLATHATRVSSRAYKEVVVASIDAAAARARHLTAPRSAGSVRPGRRRHRSAR